MCSTHRKHEVWGSRGLDVDEGNLQRWPLFRKPLGWKRHLTFPSVQSYALSYQWAQGSCHSNGSDGMCAFRFQKQLSQSHTVRYIRFFAAPPAWSPRLTTAMFKRVVQQVFFDCSPSHCLTVESLEGGFHCWRAGANLRIFCTCARTRELCLGGPASPHSPRSLSQHPRPMHATEHFSCFCVHFAQAERAHFSGGWTLGCAVGSW